MTVQRKQTRIFWLNAVLNFIPDAVLAYVVMRVTESGWEVFALVFFGLWGVYLAIWTKNSIWRWLVFFLWGRRAMASTMLSGIRANAYPEPDDLEKSGDDYLQKLVADDSLPVDTRLKAMIDLTELHAVNRHQGLQRFLQLSYALDDALEQYKNQFPPKAAIKNTDHDADAGEPVTDDEASAEAEILAKVQATCRVAAMSAGNRDNPNEQRRFESRIEKALGLANGMRDEFYRSAAFHQIASALIKDNQLDRAQELARQITVDMISEKVEAELSEARA